MGNITEEEALDKWCPFARFTTFQGETGAKAIGNRESFALCRGSSPSDRCIGSACMAWRWSVTPEAAEYGRKQGWPHSSQIVAGGYCGLACQPSS